MGGRGDQPIAGRPFDGPAEIAVSTDVATTNEAGVPLDAQLRDLLVRTIVDANGVHVGEGSTIEEARAAESLAMSSSAIGVKAPRLTYDARLATR